MSNTDVRTFVCKGLERLADGRANDAVRLAFAEELPDPEELEQMDLYNVSEIKRVKGGGVEIKLFDRQKALEKLYEYSISANAEENVSELISALQDDNS
jgi:hypothetical protein